MQWTIDKPTKNGIYWYWPEDSDRPYLRFVSMPNDRWDDSQVYITYFGTELFDTEWPIGGRWYGPVEAPKKDW